MNMYVRGGRMFVLIMQARQRGCSRVLKERLPCRHSTLGRVAAARKIGTRRRRQPDPGSYFNRRPAERTRKPIDQGIFLRDLAGNYHLKVNL